MNSPVALLETKSLLRHPAVRLNAIKQLMDMLGHAVNTMPELLERQFPRVSHIDARTPQSTLREPASVDRSLQAALGDIRIEHRSTAACQGGSPPSVLHRY